MFNLAKLRERRENGEKGFTLIELLVVVVIIGILIAIAIPVYMNYKKGAADKSAMSDLRNAVVQLEQCNTDNGGYPSVTSTGAVTLCGTSTTSLKLSDGTTLNYLTTGSTAATNTKYELMAWNTKGSGSTTNYYCYASAAGGQISPKALTSAQPSAVADSCPTS